MPAFPPGRSRPPPRLGVHYPWPVRCDGSRLRPRPLPARRLTPRAPVLVPLGATEQHGSALPLGTDTIIGEGMVATTISKLPPDFFPLT